MLLPHLLVGLASLAGMVVTSPTPMDARRDGDIAAPAAPPKRLVVYTQESFQGPGYEIDAEHRCYKFQAPVYKNLHAYGVVDQVCYFMDTDDCSGRVLITANALGTELWDIVDVGGSEGYAAMLTAVYCGERLAMTPVEADPSVEAIGGVIKAGPAPDRRSKDTKLSPAGGPGETTLCYTDERCVTLSANDNCVFVPGEVNHMVRKIYQDAGSICKYYGSNCNAPEPILGVNSHTGPKYVELEGWVGNMIGYVKCKGQWGARQARGATASVELGPAALQLQARDLTPGNVRGCNPENDCQYVQPALKCKEFPAGIANNLASILQWKGSICKYYSSTDCTSSLVLTSIAGSQDYSPNLGWSDGGRIASVYCEVARSPSTLEAGTTVHSVSTSLETRDDWKPVSSSNPTSDGPLVVCHDVNMGGKCVAYTDAPACANNPFGVDAIESFTLEKDWRCAFYPANDCQPTNGPPQYVDSKNDAIRVDDVTYWISSMTCMRSPLLGVDVDAGPASTSLQTRDGWEPVSGPDATSEYYLFVCHDVNLGGKCFGYTGEACANNPFNVDAIESLYLEQGWRCAMYPVNDCQPTHGPPHYIDSKNDFVLINDVDYWISSITCMRSPYLGLEGRAAANTSPGDATICDWLNYVACGDINNAMDQCQPIYTEYSAPGSIIQYEGAVCKWYEKFGCLRDGPENKYRMVDSRNGTVSIGNTGDYARMKSVECRAEPW